jgi:acyl-[acyl-carrier-protein]-phospholipid O-acyltransferase/long-chain-fatty-acid--[acyl-carrier-protein] ligase
VEQLAINAWPDGHHAAISIVDAKKGEQIILVTTQKQAVISDLIAASPGISNISIPKKILIVDSIPVMATGKINYPAVLNLTNELKFT